MKHTLKLFFTYLFLTIPIIVKGQTGGVKFQNIGTKDGLSYSLVTSIIEDDKGFLWVATQNGLNRYDGYEFKQYFADLSNKTPLKNDIVKLFKDSFGKIWIHYLKEGVERFDPETGIFYTFKPDSSDPNSIASDKLYEDFNGLNYTDFFEDSNHDIWIASEKGVNRYNRKSDNFTSFQYDKNNISSLSNNYITTIAEDKLGYLWVGTKDGLNRIERSTGKIKRIFSFSTNPELKSKPIISKIYFHDDGSIWVGTINMGLLILQNSYDDGSLKYIQYKGQILKPTDELAIYEILKTSTGKLLLGTSKGVFDISYFNNKIQITGSKIILQTSIFQIVEDDNGYIWAGGNSSTSDENLYRFDKTLSNFRSYENDNNSTDKTVRLSFIQKGKNGLIYIGTVKGGFYKININAKKFGVINTSSSNRLHITNNNVYSIYEDSKNNLWVGTAEELNIINLRTGDTKNLKNHKKSRKNISYNYSKELESKLIGSIKETKDGKIWLGSYDYKVSLYDPKKDLFINFHHNPKDTSSFTGWSIRTICVTDSDETYLGGTGLGLCKANTNRLTFKHYRVEKGKGPSDAWVNAIIEDKNHLLWLGTFNGLNSFDPKTDKFTYYQKNSSNESIHTKTNVRSILEPQIHNNNNNTLWIGTNKGLEKFNKKTGDFKLFTQQNGLPNNTILGILEDKEGFLWLSTLNGLAKFDPVTFKVINYTTEDGLQSNEFNEGAYFKNSDGIMYFGGVNGITYFNPEDIYNYPYHGNVILTNLKINQHNVHVNDTINGKVILNKTITYTNELKLNHKDRLISFEFATSNMVAPNDIQYRYKLENYEKEWNEVSENQRFANYSDLKSGNFTLVIDSSDGDGAWSDNPLILKINVSPYFWEKLWFLLAVAILIFTVIVLYIQWHTRNLKQQKRLLEKEVQERTMELKKTNQDLKDKNNEISEMSKTIHEMDLIKLRFFTNISHEFRTPLTLILNPTEKLIKLNKYTDTEVVKDNLKVIRRNSKRLYKLINQLLELPKIDSGTLKLLVSKGDIIAYSQDILNMFKNYAHSKNIQIKFSSKFKELQIYFDRDKIEKILYNFLSNAINFTPNGGRIELSISENNLLSKKAICITIKDSGKGIPKDQIAYIFDRFYQIENNTKNQKISVGIGLSLVKSLVQIYKGEIKVNSEINKGTEFKVLLPIEKKSFEPDEILTNIEFEPAYNYSKSMLAVTEEQGIETPLRESTNNNEITIVIVEDNKDLNKFLCNELNSEYHVFTAENGKTGLELIKKHLPNIVISDIMMPVMDGITLCKEVKNNIETSHIPVFLLTAKSEQEDQLLGLDVGADDYISKPFNVDSLKLRISNAITARKILLDKFSNDLNPIPEGIKISTLDHNLLKKINEFVKENIDSEITGDILAEILGLSKSNLYKKLKDLTGISVNIYIRNIRISVAAQLLKKDNYNISEVAYAVGFNNPKYFSSCFMKYYGKSPRSYMIEK